MVVAQALPSASHVNRQSKSVTAIGNGSARSQNRIVALDLAHEIVPTDFRVSLGVAGPAKRSIWSDTDCDERPDAI